MGDDEKRTMAATWQKVVEQNRSVCHASGHYTDSTPIIFKQPSHVLFSGCALVQNQQCAQADGWEESCRPEKFYPFGAASPRSLTRSYGTKLLASVDK